MTNTIRRRDVLRGALAASLFGVVGTSRKVYGTDPPAYKPILDYDKIQTGINEKIDAFKATVPGMLTSDDPIIKKAGYELCATCHDLLPDDFGIIETSAAISGTALVQVKPEDWQNRRAEVIRKVHGNYDEVVVYAFTPDAQPASQQHYQGTAFASTTLSFNFEAGKSSIYSDLAIMMSSPNLLLGGVVTGRQGLLGGIRRNFQKDNAYCGGCGDYQTQNGSNLYKQGYQNCGGDTSQVRGGGGGRFFGNQPGYRNGNTWVNTGHQGGGQGVLGANCCSRGCYGIGLQGSRNSKFSDVKGIGLRQSFMRYEGPPFGEGRLLNFFVNPTCVQRARRRLMIVIGISVATAGGGGVPFLIL